VTRLRKMMLEELQRRNYSDGTIRHHLRSVSEFAEHFGKQPDKLGLDELRSYQVYLLKERKLAPGSVVNHVAGLRFFFVKTLKRHEYRDFLPYPKEQQRLPTVLSLEEVARLINASGTLYRRALLMTLYATGMRRSEVSHLKIADIDSQRMMIRVDRGKGGKSRDLPLTPALLETLREYWRWRQPQMYLFPSRSAVRISRSPTRWCGSPAAKPLNRPSFASASRRIPCVTVGPRTYWKPAPICGPFRCCWAMAIWRPQRSICTCRPSTCTRSSTRWRALRSPM
jgi:integrase/recombinase XerD